MKKLMVAVLALGILAMSSLAFAQAEPGDVGVFADTAGTQSTLVVTPGFFTFYVVGFELTPGLKAIEWGLTDNIGFLVQSATFVGPLPTNFGTNTDVAAATGACVDGAGVVVLATYAAATFAMPADDSTICIGPFSNSSFSPPTPGYSDCTDTLRPFGVAQNGNGAHPDGCLVVNATDSGPVATESTSFGGVKARF